MAYRASKKVVAGVENSIKAKPEEFQQAVSDFQRGVQDFHNKDYRNLASSAMSATADLTGTATPGPETGISNRVREFSEGARPGGVPRKESRAQLPRQRHQWRKHQKERQLPRLHLNQAYPLGRRKQLRPLAKIYNPISTKGYETSSTRRTSITDCRLFPKR